MGSHAAFIEARAKGHNRAAWPKEYNVVEYYLTWGDVERCWAVNTAGNITVPGGILEHDCRHELRSSDSSCALKESFIWVERNTHYKRM
jgi:GT2 family glycosyltransferase